MSEANAPVGQLRILAVSILVQVLVGRVQEVAEYQLAGLTELLVTFKRNLASSNVSEKSLNFFS